MQKPPAIPQELKTDVIIYRKRTVGKEDRSPTGQPLFSFVKHRQVKVAVKRSKSENVFAEHAEGSEFRDYFVGNWWDWMDVTENDVILRLNDKRQFVFTGPPVSHRQQNRWAILEVASDSECLPGIVSCNCKEETPNGTEDVKQNIQP